MYFIKKLKTQLWPFYFKLRIIKKWVSDSRILPLHKEHWELYNIIHKYYFHKLGYFPELINCRDYNDRMQWLRLFDQDEEIIRCSDKIRVRERVKERLGEQYLVKLFQVHERFEDINFDELPESFVIKANHDSGTVIPVREKRNFDKGSARERINKALSKPFGWVEGEWAYSYIQPKVFVEEFIEPEKPELPSDYKFYCVEGKVKLMHYIYDRNIEGKEQVIDSDGTPMNVNIYPGLKPGYGFVKPELWNELKRVAEKMAYGFKFVRVDLYLSNEKIYVGEMTFWPMSGVYKGDGQKKIGPLLDFDRTTFKLPVYKRMKKAFPESDFKVDRN